MKYYKNKKGFTPIPIFRRIFYKITDRAARRLCLRDNENQLSVSGLVRGFTLIELVIAIFVLSVGIITVLVMFPLGIQTVRLSEMATSAVQLGQEKTEEIISKTYDEISIGTATENPLSSPFNAYRRETKIIYVDPTLGLQETVTDKGIKKIEISVFWRSPLGASEKNIKITTLISRR